tara:strand:+ start:5517 stop:5930 length:414 start_codon:yes stop_codon:yes gene_type:complete
MKKLLALTSQKLSATTKMGRTNFVVVSLDNSGHAILEHCIQDNKGNALRTLCCYLKVSKDFDSSVDFTEEELTEALIADGASQADLDKVSNIYRTRGNATRKTTQNFARKSSGRIKPHKSGYAPLGVRGGPDYPCEY